MSRLTSVAAVVALVLACGGKADSKAAGGEAGAAAADTGSKPLIALIRAADWMGSEWSEDAIRVGLLEADLEAGRDYELKISSAQGDLATKRGDERRAAILYRRAAEALQDFRF